jgi:hypothetical protein
MDEDNLELRGNSNIQVFIYSRFSLSLVLKLLKKIDLRF